MAKAATDAKRHSDATKKKLRIAGIERSISPAVTQQRRETYAKTFHARVKSNFSGRTLDPDFDEGM